MSRPQSVAIAHLTPSYSMDRYRQGVSQGSREDVHQGSHEDSTRSSSTHLSTGLRPNRPSKPPTMTLSLSLPTQHLDLSKRMGDESLASEARRRAVSGVIAGLGSSRSILPFPYPVSSNRTRASRSQPPIYHHVKHPKISLFDLDGKHEPMTREFLHGPRELASYAHDLQVATLEAQQAQASGRRVLSMGSDDTSLEDLKVGQLTKRRMPPIDNSASHFGPRRQPSHDQSLDASSMETKIVTATLPEPPVSICVTVNPFAHTSPCFMLQQNETHQKKQRSAWDRSRVRANMRQPRTVQTHTTSEEAEPLAFWAFRFLFEPMLANRRVFKPSQFEPAKVVLPDWFEGIITGDEKLKELKPDYNVWRLLSDISKIVQIFAKSKQTSQMKKSNRSTSPSAQLIGLGDSQNQGLKRASSPLEGDESLKVSAKASPNHSLKRVKLFEIEGDPFSDNQGDSKDRIGNAELDEDEALFPEKKDNLGVGQAKKSEAIAMLQASRNEAEGRGATFGHCDICRKSYRGPLSLHLKTSAHMEFVANQDNYAALDEFATAVSLRTALIWQQESSMTSSLRATANEHDLVNTGEGEDIEVVQVIRDEGSRDDDVESVALSSSFTSTSSPKSQEESEALGEDAQQLEDSQMRVEKEDENARALSDEPKRSIFNQEKSSAQITPSDRFSSPSTRPTRKSSLARLPTPPAVSNTSRSGKSNSMQRAPIKQETYAPQIPSVDLFDFTAEENALSVSSDASDKPVTPRSLVDRAAGSRSPVITAGVVTHPKAKGSYDGQKVSSKKPASHAREAESVESSSDPQSESFESESESESESKAEAEAEAVAGTTEEDKPQKSVSLTETHLQKFPNLRAHIFKTSQPSPGRRKAPNFSTTPEAHKRVSLEKKFSASASTLSSNLQADTGKKVQTVEQHPTQASFPLNFIAPSFDQVHLESPSGGTQLKQAQVSQNNSQALNPSVQPISPARLFQQNRTQFDLIKAGLANLLNPTVLGVTPDPSTNAALSTLGSIAFESEQPVDLNSIAALAAEASQRLYAAAEKLALSVNEPSNDMKSEYEFDSTSSYSLSFGGSMNSEERMDSGKEIQDHSLPLSLFEGGLYPRPPEIEEKPKRGRGRPKGAKNKPKPPGWIPPRFRKAEQK